MALFQAYVSAGRNSRKENTCQSVELDGNKTLAPRKRPALVPLNANLLPCPNAESATFTRPLTKQVKSIQYKTQYNLGSAFIFDFGGDMIRMLRTCGGWKK